MCQCWDCVVIQLILDMSVSGEQCSHQMNPCGCVQSIREQEIDFMGRESAVIRL